MSRRPSPGSHLGSNPAEAIANDPAQLSSCRCWHQEENLGDDCVQSLHGLFRSTGICSERLWKQGEPFGSNCMVWHEASFEMTKKLVQERNSDVDSPVVLWSFRRAFPLCCCRRHCRGFDGETSTKNGIAKNNQL